MERFIYEAVLTPNEIGGYDVRFPELGITTQGDDLSDAAYMAQDALHLHISSALKEGASVPTAGRFGAEKPSGGMVMGIVTLAEAGSADEFDMTVQEAADILDVSRARIYAMIKDGSIRSAKSGNMRMVSASDVMDRFNSPREAGRPRKEAAQA